jgi:uncharacterized protein with NAD-binding domain and iron-sulfur cluster
MARQKALIVGGGIAGLTVAHELIERDFDVVVCERRLRSGGKAASVRVKDVPNVEPVPGEHGFRFFPGWYRHLPDTLGRIPSDRHRGDRNDRKVLDHLVNVNSNLLLTYNRPPIPILLHAPRSADQVQKLVSFVREIQKMGLSLEDALLFFRRLVEFLSVPDDVRRQKYDGMSWTAFIDAGNRTPAFRVLASHTRTLVAAKPTEASAYTIATMAVRTLFDSSLTIDRVLDGPTSEVWIDPWYRYLEGRGVEFRFGFELEAIKFEKSAPKIESLHFSPVDRRYFSCADKEGTFREFADWRRLRKPPKDVADQYYAALTEKRSDAAKKLGAELMGHVAKDEPKERFPARPFNIDDADYYVFAIPIEQMAYYVNRSTMMTYHDPSLRNIVRLSGSVDWMVGIQFYLKSPLNIEAGHIVCADSEWSLTAIDQTQFWRDAKLPPEVQSILSVDISAWDQKGRFVNKEAFRCTTEEIKDEVWSQLKDSFNRPGNEVLRDSMLLGYYLDENVADRYDRKKQAAYNRGQQAAYNRAQAVRFSAEDRLAQGLPEGELPFIYGERVQNNIEPILVNRPGSLALRPSVRSEQIPNLFLAADYVDTATNLACMEGANEAARLAVNAILDQAGSQYDKCQTWDFADRDVLSTLAAFAHTIEQGPGVRRSIEAAASAASTLGAMATRAGQNILQMWKKR